MIAFGSLFVFAFLAPVLVWPAIGLATGITGAATTRQRLLLAGVIANLTATVTMAVLPVAAWIGIAGGTPGWRFAYLANVIFGTVYVAAVLVLPGILGGAGVWVWRRLGEPPPPYPRTGYPGKR